MPSRTDRTNSRKNVTIHERCDTKERGQRKGHKTATGHKYRHWLSLSFSFEA